MGGIDTRKAAAQLRSGCDVVVGTPATIATFIQVRPLHPHTRAHTHQQLVATVGATGRIERALVCSG